MTSAEAAFLPGLELSRISTDLLMGGTGTRCGQRVRRWADGEALSVRGPTTGVGDAGWGSVRFLPPAGCRAGRAAAHGA